MDHARVNISSSSISCGVRELSRMSDEADQNLFAIANSCYHPSRGQPPAFFIWSNLDGKEALGLNGGEGTNGHRLKLAIEKLGFGYVFKSLTEINPNTGSPIAIWVWQVDHEAFKAWYKLEKIAKLQRR